ncbi:MAG TPA: tyrosine-type recombinase/integrase [Ferruginibacter sp.]|jgi:integrase/recombinase XerD|nr:tyrosine-type recombinase/integrase [Ferruginibacter sp.]
MGISIRYKKQKNKEVSLYLDIIYNGTRYYEFLDIKLKPEKTPIDRDYNKQQKEYAERIKTKRWNEILNHTNGINIKKTGIINFFDFADTCISSKGFDRGYTAVISKLKEYANNKPLYTSAINERYLNKFYDYLDSSLTGETPSCYFKRLKKLLAEATKQKIFSQNPSMDIRCRPFKSKQKDTLSFDEIKILINTDCPNEEVKSAFIFSCLTGIRFCDVKDLTGKNIKDNEIELIQKKTKVKVIVILNDDAIQILKKRHKLNTALLFKLPSHTACLKNLRVWLRSAEINKHITYHCSRHSFGANLIDGGTDIYTTSKLLGHTSLKHTERYVRESQKLKMQAVNNFPRMFN